MKQKIAKAIAARIKDGETIGIGAGSTVEAAIEAIAERVKEENLKVSCFASTAKISSLAESAGLVVLEPDSLDKIDWIFDGADEVDPELNLIKGGGGHMLSEKMLAKRGPLTIIVTEEKLVSKLGEKFPVPVEIIPEGIVVAQEELKSLGATEQTIRKSGSEDPVLTDHGNIIVDTKFAKIAPKLEIQINQITGVVENGLFFGLTTEVLVAKRDGIYSLMREGNTTKEEKVSS